MKESKVQNDKMHENAVEDKIRDKILSGELDREYFGGEKVCKFIFLLKRRSSTQVDTMKELIEEEFIIVVKNLKEAALLQYFRKEIAQHVNVRFILIEW